MSLRSWESEPRVSDCEEAFSLPRRSCAASRDGGGAPARSETRWYLWQSTAAVDAPFGAEAGARHDSERIVVTGVPGSVKPSLRTAVVSSFTIGIYRFVAVVETRLTWQAGQDIQSLLLFLLQDFRRVDLPF